MPIYVPGKLTLRQTWQPMDPDAAAYITAVETADGQSLEEKVKIAIDNFVLGCKADGIWNAIKVSCILAGARTLAGALVPLVGTAPTIYNFVAGDYNRETGLKGDGSTKYLDTERSYSDDPQNSNHIALHFSALSAINAEENYAGAGDSGVGFTRLGYFTSQLRYGVRTLQINKPATLTPGFMAAGRSNGSNVLLRYNGVSSTASATSVSTSGINLNYTVFVTNYRDLGLLHYSSSTIAFYSIGESLDLALLDARVTDLINAIGVAIP